MKPTKKQRKIQKRFLKLTKGRRVYHFTGNASKCIKVSHFDDIFWNHFYSDKEGVGRWWIDPDYQESIYGWYLYTPTSWDDCETSEERDAYLEAHPEIETVEVDHIMEDIESGREPNTLSIYPEGMETRFEYTDPETGEFYRSGDEVFGWTTIRIVHKGFFTNTNPENNQIVVEDKYGQLQSVDSISKTDPRKKNCGECGQEVVE